MQDDQTSTPDRIAWLDGLRGIAILTVLVSHLALVTAREHPSTFASAVFRTAGAGWVGVDLFFVLSGMLITGILLDTKGSQGYWRRFYARRVLRIFPLYYVFLIAALILAPLLYPHSHGGVVELRHGMPWFALYLTNAWIALRNGFNVNIFGTGPLWSLSVEEQFYLAWPFVVLLLSRRALARTCIALIVAAPLVRALMAIAGSDALVLYTATPARCDTLAAGALIAITLRDEHARGTLAAHAPNLFAAAAIVIAALAFARGGFDNHDRMALLLGLTPLVLLMGALVGVGLRDGATTRALAAAPLRWLGRYSYAIYLFHLPIITWLAAEPRLIDRLARTGMPGPLADASFWVIASAMSLAAGWMSWHLLEKHFLKLKRYVRYDREVHVAPPPDMAAAPQFAPQREAA